MDSTQLDRRLPNEGPEQAYDGPPDYRQVGRHAVFPKTDHNEVARLNFLAQMNKHLATRVAPFVKDAWELRAGPAFQAEHGRGPQNRHEVREALVEDPYFQAWSALRRTTMEQRQEAGRFTSLRQAETLAAIADDLTRDDARLSLDPSVAVPDYIAAVDHHCMPGSYYAELFPGDVSVAASYDHGIFATTGGELGRFTDGAGKAVAAWVQRNQPDFHPKRILDLGSTLGHSAGPIAQGYPDAEVVAVDIGAPMLRYGLARAKSLGIDNIRFIQADAADLSGFADESFDWVQTTMFLHELALEPMKAIFRESYRVLKPGGLVIHVEQPQYSAGMPLYEQAMRDWDAFYNNEPFWSALHELDIDQFLAEAGFAREGIIHAGVTGVVDRDVFPDAADDTREDFGRKAAWRVIGARK